MKLLLPPVDDGLVTLFPYGYAESVTQVAMLRTPRLRLRGWRTTDVDQLNRIRVAPAVTAHLPLGADRPLTVADQMDSWARSGFGPWAVELRGSGEFIGSIGLTFPGHWPSPELSWVLDPRHWGQGYATEGARAAVRFAFESCNIDQLIAVCTPENLRSERIMQKLGMIRSSVVTCSKRSIPVTQYSLAAAQWDPAS